jgi:hypothetical protein
MYGDEMDGSPYGQEEMDGEEQYDEMGQPMGYQEDMYGEEQYGDEEGQYAN